MEERDFKDFMQQSKLEIEFPGFEETVMEKVHAREASRRSVWRSLKISWLFFFIGTFFGILLTHLMSDFQIPLMGDNSKMIFLFIEIGIVAVIASQFDSLIRFTFKKRG